MIPVLVCALALIAWAALLAVAYMIGYDAGYSEGVTDNRKRGRVYR